MPRNKLFKKIRLAQFKCELSEWKLFCNACFKKGATSSAVLRDFIRSYVKVEE